MAALRIESITIMAHAISPVLKIRSRDVTELFTPTDTPAGCTSFGTPDRSSWVSQDDEAS